jgi:HK97 gp10 family phage protein
MARGVQFEVVGLSNLKVSIDALRDDVRERIEDAIDDTAHAIQARARVNVPRDRGDLARAIQLGGKGLRRSVGLSDGNVPSRGGRNTAHLNPWVYGAFVEFGLRARKMLAQPFMGPAADHEQTAHDLRVEKALDGAVGDA